MTVSINSIWKEETLLVWGRGEWKGHERQRLKEKSNGMGLTNTRVRAIDLVLLMAVTLALRILLCHDI